ncbi:MAG TPA: AAA family ATPase, partial [Mycobacteriales bacterium]|nr:AAA family ATPase [Mycobacteriales bacterium]
MVDTEERASTGFPLVARAGQMRALRTAFTRAERGEARAVLISGDAGVGKTRLLQEIGEFATGRGAQVLTGRCLDVSDGGLPYLPFAEALAPLAAEPTAPPVRSRPALSRLLPGLAGEQHHPADDSPRRVSRDHDLGELQLFDAVLGVLTDISESEPVVLVLEDLHWADGATRNLLAFLVSRLRSQRLLILASYREEDLHRRHPLRAALAELIRAQTVERIELPPFDAADARAFIEALAEAPLPPGIVAEVIERSQGNPFFAEELLASQAEGSTLPAGLAEVLLSRLERLGAATQRLLRIVSVADGPVSHAALGEVAGLDELELDEALRDAVQHHILVIDNGYFTFRHALLQEAVYGDLLPGERTRIHHSYAARLLAAPERRGRDAALAHHSLQSNDLVTALAASQRAATEAEQIGAPGAALQHIEQALRIWDAVQPGDRPAGLDELSLLREASYFAGTSGEPERAIAYARSAVQTLDETVPAERAGELWAVLAQAMIGLENTWDEGIEAIDQAWKLVESVPAGPTRATVLAIRAMILRAIDRPVEARSAAEAAVADGQASGCAGAEADALITLGALADADGDIDGSREMLRRAQQQAQAADALDVELRARYFMALSYDDRGEIAEALASYAEGIEYAAQTGLTWSSFGIELRARHLFLQYVQGDWPSGQRTWPLRRVSTAAVSRVVASWAYIVAGRGDLDEAERLVADLRAHWQTDVWVAISAGAVGIESAFWRGDQAAAAERAQEAIGWLEEVEPWLLGGVRISALGVMACASGAEQARLRGGDPAAALDRGAAILAHGRGCIEHGRPRGASLGPE